MYQRYQKQSNPNPRLHLEREKRNEEGCPDPWEKAPEEEGRPERGLRRPEERQTAAAVPREGHELERDRRGG
jgi:hypothetical protein